jgi:hypothetical protein
MLQVLPVSLPQQCPRCAAVLYREDDEAWCLYCGERVFATRPLMKPLPTAAQSPAGPRKRGRPRKVRGDVA